MFFSIEQIDDTQLNSPFLIFWIFYLVYRPEEILMRFCQFRPIICQMLKLFLVHRSSSTLHQLVSSLLRKSAASVGIFAYPTWLMNPAINSTLFVTTLSNKSLRFSHFPQFLLILPNSSSSSALMTSCATSFSLVKEKEGEEEGDEPDDDESREWEEKESEILETGGTRTSRSASRGSSRKMDEEVEELTFLSPSYPSSSSSFPYLLMRQR